MMKRLISTLAVLSLVLVMVPRPSTAQAQSLVDRIDAICTQLPERATTITKEIETREAALEESYKNIVSNLEKRQDNTNQRVAEIRKNSETRRFDAYKALRQRSSNEAQSLAIEAFISSMEKAVGDRQAAYDRAISKFHESIRQSSQGNISAAKEAVSSFKAGVTNVLDDTNVSCSSESKPTDIRQNFISRLKNARLSYSSDINNEFSSQRSELVRIRNEELTRARAQFEETVHSITRDLSSILGD